MTMEKLAAAAGIVLALGVGATGAAFAKQGADDPATHIRGGHGGDDGPRHR